MMKDNEGNTNFSTGISNKYKMADNLIVFGKFSENCIKQLLRLIWSLKLLLGAKLQGRIKWK